MFYVNANVLKLILKILISNAYNIFENMNSIVQSLFYVYDEMQIYSVRHIHQKRVALLNYRTLIECSSM